MTELYDRDAWVQVDTKKIVGLRLKFKAEKSLNTDPNTLDLHIFNLKAETRAAMQKKGAAVLLVAGYKGATEILFSGEARTIDHVKGPGPEWDTHVQCGDGEIAFAKSFTSISFGPGTPWGKVVEAIGKDLKVSTADALAKIGKGDLDGAVDTFLNGYTAHGSSAREMDRVMRAAGLQWSVQDGKLLILKPDGTNAEQAIVLGPRTGLLGSPDHGAPEKDGSPSLLKARSLLQAGLRPGRSLKLDTTSIRGFYRVEKVTHQGDTHGSEWYSDVEALPL